MKHQILSAIVAAIIFATTAFVTAARAADPAAMPTVTDPKALRLKPADMQWWQDAKFGMFIHWGLYAIPAQGEWYMNDKKVPVDEYRKLMEQFDPQHYDPAVWAQVAKAAGMKYMVLTARHHDGFALWDSAASYDQFDAVHSAAKRDLVAPFVKAARDAGLRVGLYYSPMDWRFPGYFDPHGLPENAALMKQQAWGQVEELLKNYGPIDILWYDGGWLAMKGSDADAAPFWESDKLAALARQYQPKVIISPRSGWVGDFTIDEGGGAVTGPIKTGPWEKCVNLNEVSWGYNTRQNLMSRDRALAMLINTVVRGGNMLLNVGPDKDGIIPATHVKRLQEIGDWLAKYGESIYGTRAGPFQPVNGQFGATYRDKTIYLHVLNWKSSAASGGRGAAASEAAAKTNAAAATDTASKTHVAAKSNTVMIEPERLTLPTLPQKIVAVRVLTGDGKATFTQSDANVTITLPADQHDALDTILAVDCDGNVGP